MAGSTFVPSPRLLALCRRRWALPILAEFHRAEQVSGWKGGTRFVTLCHRLNVNQAAVRQSLDHLIEVGFVQRNSGYGHPLRPEYILTRRGERLSPACEAVDSTLEKLRIRPLGLRRWSLPVLQVVDRLEPARFTAVAHALGDVTARALTLSLKSLCAAELVEREVVDAFPVAIAYRPAADAESLARHLERI